MAGNEVRINDIPFSFVCRIFDEMRERGEPFLAIPYYGEVHIAGSNNGWLQAADGKVLPSKWSAVSVEDVRGGRDRMLDVVVNVVPGEDFEFKIVVIAGGQDENLGGRQKAIWIDCPEYGFGRYRRGKSGNWVLPAR